MISDADIKPKPVPENEVARLHRLDATGILDTEAQASFDHLVKLAQTTFEVETSLVSLIDKGRQWFKARIGLDAAGTSRDIAFCAHALMHTEPLVVLDTHDDIRFRNKPLVLSGPMIRFYAGAPLITHDGFALGTLCIIDPAPRESFSARDRALLSAMAAVALQLIDRQLSEITAIRSTDLHGGPPAIQSLAVIVTSLEADAIRGVGLSLRLWISSPPPKCREDPNPVFSRARVDEHTTPIRPRSQIFDERPF